MLLNLVSKKQMIRNYFQLHFPTNINFFNKYTSEQVKTRKK